MNPNNPTSRKASYATGALMLGSFLPSCMPTVDLRTQEYWDRTEQRAREMVSGDSPENYFDRKILELTEILADTLNPNYIKKGKTYRMGFLEMSDLDRETVRRLDFYATEKFLTFAFMNEGLGSHFDLVERFLLENIVGELEFEQGSGYIDKQTAQRLGEIYGIDFIGQGIITLGPTSIDINSRIVETERGSVIAAGSVKIKNSPATEKWIEGKMKTRWKREPRETPW